MSPPLSASQRRTPSRSACPSTRRGKTFLEQFYAETAPFEPFEQRLREIRQEIAGDR